MGDAVKIGVLLPTSGSRPELPVDFLDGMRTALAGCGDAVADRPVELRVEEIGVGQSLAPERARKLIDGDRCCLVTGVLNAAVAAHVGDLIGPRGDLLLVSGAGANLPRNDEAIPSTFHCELGLWQGSFALGQWAAANLGSRALVAVSHFDCGFDAHVLFRLGFEQGGGEVCRVQLTHVPPDPGELEPLFDNIRGDAPDVVFAGYSGSLAAPFVRAYAEAGLPERFPLLGSGFLVDAEALAEAGESATGIRACGSWWPRPPVVDEGAEHDSVRAFFAAFTERCGRVPGPFSAVGFDVARLVVEAAAAVDGAVEDRTRFGEVLAQVSFDGARGPVRVEPESRHASPPLYLTRVERLGDEIGSAVQTRLDPVSPNDSRLAELRSALRSGWVNPYLCA